MSEKKCCKVCLQKGNFSSLDAKEMYLGTKKNFKYFFCNNCGSLFKADMEDDVASLYKNYHSFKEPLKNGYLKKLIKKTSINSTFFRYLMKGFISRFSDGMKILSFAKVFPKKEDKILDVGAGSGNFIQSLQDLGFSQAIGIDPFIEQGTPYVLKASFFDMKGPFDIIMFHHSLEHMKNLLQVAKHLAKILTPQGKVIIRMPNIDSFSFRVFKENWQGIHPPFHIILPSFKGLQKVFSSVGIKIVRKEGEQFLALFLMSKEILLNIPQQNKTSSLQFLLNKSKLSRLPWHSSQELKHWKKMIANVKKNDLCDHVAYYLKKK